jgi:hypothetical protein
MRLLSVLMQLLKGVMVVRRINIPSESLVLVHAFYTSIQRSRVTFLMCTGIAA